MEPNDNQLSSFFHHHNHQQQHHHLHHQQQQQQPHANSTTVASATATTTTTTTASPTNGLDGSHILYPSAVSSQLEPAKRKRGRPRKYGTPEQALAAKKASTSSFSPTSDNNNNKNSNSFTPSPSFTSRKSHSLSLGSFLSLSLRFLLLLRRNFSPNTPIFMFMNWIRAFWLCSHLLWLWILLMKPCLFSSNLKIEQSWFGFKFDLIH